MGKILLGSWWCLSFSGSVYVSTVTSNFSGLFGREHHHHRLLFRVMMILLMTTVFVVFSMLSMITVSWEKILRESCLKESIHSHQTTPLIHSFIRCWYEQISCIRGESIESLLLFITAITSFCDTLFILQLAFRSMPASYPFAAAGFDVIEDVVIVVSFSLCEDKRRSEDERSSFLGYLLWRHW